MAHDHDHDHDHDCGHDHDNDDSIESALAHIVLSFCNLVFAQLEYEEFDEDVHAQRRTVQFIYGAVLGLTEMEDLQPAQVTAITVHVLKHLFPWDDAELIRFVSDLEKDAHSEESAAFIEEGRVALDGALEATARLSHILTHGTGD